MVARWVLALLKPTPVKSNTPFCLSKQSLLGTCHHILGTRPTTEAEIVKLSSLRLPLWMLSSSASPTVPPSSWCPAATGNQVRRRLLKAGQLLSINRPSPAQPTDRPTRALAGASTPSRPPGPLEICIAVKGGEQKMTLIFSGKILEFLDFFAPEKGSTQFWARRTENSSKTAIGFDQILGTFVGTFAGKHVEPSAHWLLEENIVHHEGFINNGWSSPTSGKILSNGHKKWKEPRTDRKKSQNMSEPFLSHVFQVSTICGSIGFLPAYKLMIDRRYLHIAAAALRGPRHLAKCHDLCSQRCVFDWFLFYTLLRCGFDWFLFYTLLI